MSRLYLKKQTDLKSDNEISGYFPEGYGFTRYDSPITEYYIKGILKKYDIIIPYSVCYKDGCARDRVNSEIVRFLKKSRPEMNMSLEKLLTSARTQECAFIAGSELTDKTVGFIEDIENKLNIELTDHDRQFLLRLFLMNNRYKIKEEKLSAENVKKEEIRKQKTELIYKYLRTCEEDLINFRKINGFENPLCDEKECKDDFDGKIPVFICWWQGEEEMPDIVKACVNSVKRNLPDNAALRIITLSNVGEYVTFNEAIVNKFNEGLIDYTHLSEVLRSELLYRYGGMWIDATYYVSNRIPKEFFDREFFTVAFERPLFGDDISMARWSTSLWMARKNHPLFQLLTEAYYIYFEKDDKVIDYFIMDYLTGIIYKEFDCVKNCIDDCVKQSPAVYELQLRLNQRFTETENMKLLTESLFYKINRRGEYHTHTSDGELTLYGYISGAVSQKEINQKQKVICCSDMTLVQILDEIREYNPDTILDRYGLFIKENLVSGVTIPDMLFHDVTIDLITEKEIPDVYHSLYNNIYEGDYNQCENYDLILV